MSKRWLLRLVCWIAFFTLFLHTAGMLVVMAVDAEEFPVAAVGRVVVMIVIPVVDRQLAQFPAFEFPGTSGTDMREKFQSLFPVSGLAQLLFLAHPGNDLVVLLVSRLGHKLPSNPDPKVSFSKFTTTPVNGDLTVVKNPVHREQF